MNLKPAAVFADRMVLQRGKPVSVFGSAYPGADIRVAIQGVSGQGKADDDGRWLIALPPLSVSLQETMTIESGEESITVTDVMVGEVFLAGGQSNMEFQMRYDQDFEAEKLICQNPFIRIFDVPKIFSTESEKRHDFSLFGFWRTCDESNLQYFSAAAYYFAQTLSAHLQVPIGIIGCSVGGSRTCCWVDEETVEKCGPQWMREYEANLRSVPDLKEAENSYYANTFIDPSHPFDNPLTDRWMKGLSFEEQKKMLQSLGNGPGGQVIGPWHEWRPCGLYHQMLETILPYTLRGVIWYQGESDETHPECYSEMMHGLIGLWREKWNDELPFLITQLAPLGTELGTDGLGFPRIRAAQEELTRQIPLVWSASTSDCGHPYDIHPKQKRPVGCRLALLALRHIYGNPLLADAPVPKTIRRTADALVIPFDHADGGLLVLGDTIHALQIFDGERELTAQTDFQAYTKGDTLVIKALPGKPFHANRVVFAGSCYYQVNLYNRAMVPAKPFESAVC